MSKARLVITSIEIEGRTVAEVIAAYDVSRPWIYELLARYRIEGAEHRRTPVIKLVDDLHVRIINAATGELLRELTIDPARDYQPLGRPPGPQPHTNRKPDPDPGSGLSGIS